MARMSALLDRISWPIVLMLVAFMGLAPFTPEPHVWEKLKMLAAGDLSRAIDVFDLVLHGTPWLILIAKVVRAATAGRTAG